MARSLNFDHDYPLLEEGLGSPVDEAGVHDSFHQLIEEHSQNAEFSEAYELQQLQKELEEEERDNVAYLSGPKDDLYRRRQKSLEETEEGQTDTPMGEQWSSDTLKVLSSMPSRTIGRNRGAIISQYYNRTMQLRRRRQSRPSIKDFSRSSRPSIRGYGIEADSTDTDGTEGSFNYIMNMPDIYEQGLRVTDMSGFSFHKPL